MEVEGRKEKKKREVWRDPCPETMTTDERDVVDLAAEEVSVALYLNMAPTHAVTLVLSEQKIFIPYAFLVIERHYFHTSLQIPIPRLPLFNR